MPHERSGLAIRQTWAGPLVGDLYLDRPESTLSAVEVGITLGPGFQRRGLATAVITAVVNALFGQGPPPPSVRRVLAIVDVENRRSRALFERLGFRVEARHVASGRRRDGSVADEVMFAVTPEQWR
jgi:RimJ/RimL family protein N-acetyltransferase